jgi:hypothetical protein
MMTDDKKLQQQPDQHWANLLSRYDDSQRTVTQEDDQVEDSCRQSSLAPATVVTTTSPPAVTTRKTNGWDLDHTCASLDDLELEIAQDVQAPILYKDSNQPPKCLSPSHKDLFQSTTSPKSIHPIQFYLQTSSPCYE